MNTPKLPSPADSLRDYCHRLAQQALDEVDPTPPVPNIPPCVPDEAQAVPTEPAGSPQVDWATDTRATCRLTNVEALAKMDWQFQALCKRERQFREFERLTPTIYPEAK